MQAILPEFEQYLARYSPVSHPVLAEMESFAKERDFPIVGPLVGRFLYQLIKAVNARRVFELGSGFGYSAFWMAMALPDDGTIICTEASLNNVDIGIDFLERGGLAQKVDFRVGDALKIFADIDGPFDFVFNDVDKEQYPRIVDLVVPKLRQGGLLVSDNLFWHGKVLSDDPDESTRGVCKFTERIFSDPRLWSTIIPLRDGIAVCLKL
jgi:predicted O-methyltransferase YrrM